MDFVLTPLLIVGGIVALVIIVVIAIVFAIITRTWYRTAAADEALVITGKAKRGAESSKIDVVSGGGLFVNPFTQRSSKLSLRSRSIEIKPTAQAANGVTVDVEGIALVKVGSNPDYIRRAAERFLSQDRAIEAFTTEVLEGALRGVVATLTVETLMKDRKALAAQIAEGIEGDLERQGLVLDSFQILGITDQGGYIEALGAQELQRVHREADTARIDAERAVAKRQIETNTETLGERTAFQESEAAAKAKVGRANAEAEQAEALRRAELQQAVLEQEANNKQSELDAEVKKVADANLYDQERKADARAYQESKEAETRKKVADADAQARTTAARAEAAARTTHAEAEAAARRAEADAEAHARRVQAEAEAEAIRQAGEAEAASQLAIGEAIEKHEQALITQKLIDQLVPMVAEFAKAQTAIGGYTVISAEGAAEHQAAQSAATLKAPFDAINAATGIDLGALIQSGVQGERTGSALAEGMRRRESAEPQE
ncbi:SPFH domain-containing protein [Gulosibacter sp. 10]|uniref:SPFH domain-containing protein n=1 Tax=Gulosibacter sp. 10 TaxID=1255570 RepID=UPI00097E8C7C|nr:SPFH domain-containing protein [Gulosibacter sp. 10]SJM65342.1 Inner membrane protein YqiK [Gulosibacter sp. 10]